MEDWNDPQGRRLPIKVDTTSNGEYVPRPLSRGEALGNQLAFDAAGTTARRLGVGRRAFLKSSCGAAATLLAFNQANAAFGGSGGRFALAPEAAFEPAAADAVLKKDGQFIFDMQLHCMDPSG
ncbi:MAG: amidohydrolase, partial [Gammaproteobacteria bacterium]|nr:amidohydrolase [Gammaproteobacteria bacterium]